MRRYLLLQKESLELCTNPDALEHRKLFVSDGFQVGPPAAIDIILDVILLPLLF